MVEVGIRDLKNRLSAYLRRVADGEQIVVTMRGRPVAELWPARDRAEREIDPEVQRLAQRGRITLARAAKDPDPPPPERTGRSASRLILEEREEDR